MRVRFLESPRTGERLGGVPVLLCVLCDSPLACHGHFLIYLDYTIEPHVISAARSYELHKVIHRRIRGVIAKKKATAATGTRTRGYRTSKVCRHVALRLFSNLRRGIGELVVAENWDRTGFCYLTG